MMFPSFRKQLLLLGKMFNFLTTLSNFTTAKSTTVSLFQSKVLKVCFLRNCNVGDNKLPTESENANVLI